MKITLHLPLSADAAYTLAALAVRGESLPRTDEERRRA